MRIAIFLFFLVLIASANAATWSGFVKTDTDTWSIIRESSNLSFNYEQSVQGQIAPVHYRHRTLSPVHSYYEDIEKNDVRVKERTAALQGSISSEEQLKLFSSINDSVNLSIDKPAGSDIYDIEFYEHWPVTLSYSKSMNYSGKEINNREFVGNSKDYAGANFLYNKEFSKERSLNMSLDRLNASILATDEVINLGEVKATRDTQYRLQTHSTGIANFKWRQVDTDDSILNQGDERFVGTYDIVKNIRMKSRFELARNDDSWLPCCSEGWSDMRLPDKKGFGASAKGIFDCSCYKVPSTAQFQR
jgi:hypothetical protein